MIFAPAPLFVFKSRLELRDKDLQEEEFQIRDSNQNPQLALQAIREDDFNMDQTEDDERDIERSIEDQVREDASGNDNNNNDKEESDKEDSKRGMFGHESILPQENVDKLAKKYGISDIYNCRAPKNEEYMSDPKSRKIVVTIKRRIQIPSLLVFIQVIKKFWIQPTQLMLNSWRYLVTYVWLYHKCNITLIPMHSRHKLNFCNI